MHKCMFKIKQESGKGWDKAVYQRCSFKEFVHLASGIKPCESSLLSSHRGSKSAVSSVVLTSFSGVEEGKEKECLVCTICTCAEL